MYLRGALQKEAGQILWDYGPEVTNSLKKLTKTLNERFGGATQSDKYRIEVRTRRRKPDETLQSLHSDIRRLMALAFPDLEHTARETIACDYFIDALAEPDLALKVRERSPNSLDEALRIALQLEVWRRDVERVRHEPLKGKAREVSKTESSVEKALKKRVAELQEEVARMKAREHSAAESKKLENSASKPNTQVTRQEDRPNQAAATSFVCWGCGESGHVIRQCPNKTAGGKYQTGPPKQVRPIDSKVPDTTIIVKYKRHRIPAVIDTGSDMTIAGLDIARKHKWRIRPCRTTTVAAANGEPMVIDGIVKQRLSVGTRLKKFGIYISPDITGLIIGVDWIKQQKKFEWDFANSRIQFDEGEWVYTRGTELGCNRIFVEQDVILPPKQETHVPVRVSHHSLTESPFVGVTENLKVPNLSHVYTGRSVIPARYTGLRVCVVNTAEQAQTLKKGTSLGPVEKAEVIDSAAAEPGNDSEEEVIQKVMSTLPDELTESQKQEVLQLLKDNSAIFSRGEFDIGRTPLVEYRIDTGENRPIRQPLRRHPFAHLDIIDEQVETMKKSGIIEQAASPWASNVVLVRKKDGTLRFCVDYRRLNAITYKDSYPLPLIDNCLNALAGSSWFSVLDLRAGYYNIPIAEEDRDKSAFVTRSGCYRFTVMPFGMTCAPGVFQRLMDFVLSGLSYITCLVYLDDVIIFGRTFEEQLVRLAEVFDRIKKANLKLKPSKCSLFQREVSFLGHVVSKSGISMQTEKIQAIRDWPNCRTLTELRAFMGTAGYYRRFVKDFSSIAAPLYELMKKGVRFVWTAGCQKAFDELKRILTSEPVLALPDDKGTYVLDTDASDYGLGAVLSQQQDGTERVIAYASRTMSRTEQKYETTRKELLAVVTGLKQFRQYLMGRHFIIRTDHMALSWLRRTPEPMPQLARWLTLIEQHDYEVVHRAGKSHGNCDGLSRRPNSGAESTESQTVNVIDRTNPNKPIEDVVPSSVRENLPQKQQTDPELGRIVQFRLNRTEPLSSEELETESELTKKLNNYWHQLEVHNGLVYRRFISNRTGEPDSLQLLLPRSCVAEVLNHCHNGPVSGHFGIKKTTEQVRRRFFWHSWKSDTERHCRTCEACCTYHRGKLNRQGALRPVLAGSPFERWYIDLTGPHPQSGRGHVYILTCVDGFTKWAEAFPIRNKEAESIAKVLVEQLFCRFGTPLSILSDQGKEVDGRIMREVCRLFGIDKLRTTPYKPSTNQVERLHRTINAVLGKTVAEHQKDWDIRLPYVMAAYRATRHESTGYSPNFLMMCRETYSPVDVIYERPDTESSQTYDGFVENIRDRMTAAYAEVRDMLRRSAERNKRYYDLKVRPFKYKKGDWVYYFNTRRFQGKQMKWVRQYTGPFLIIRTPNPLTVEIQRNRRAKAFVVHIDKVKLYTGITPASWIDGLDSASQPNHDEDRIVSNELAGPASSVDIESPSPNAELEVENEETPRRRRPKRTAGRPRHLVDYV